MSGKESVLQQQFSNTLSTLIADQVQATIHQGIAIAYSGGVDSAVLLALAIAFAREKKIPVFAFHIHHGLSPNADDWLEHCRAVCARTGSAFFAEKIKLDDPGGNGIEGAARSARYRALGDLCSKYQLSLMLTAHHQDDQAETLLLQLLRGSGVSGLSGMDSFNHAPSLLGTSKVLLARPLLRQQKQVLLDFAKKNAVDYVEDESNFDTRYTRNALRHLLMPVLAKISPGYADRLARSAQHMQAASQLLAELAKVDLDHCMVGRELQIRFMRELSNARVENLLRFWLSTLHVRMPSTARLSEIRNQLFDARADAKITIHHDELEIHRYENKIYATPKSSIESATISPNEFAWRGESVIHFPEFCGSLYFESSNYGVEIDWLIEQNLSLRLRQGSERIKLAQNRPTRDIKNHFQAFRIPFWERQELPFLYAGGALLFVAKVGMQASFCRYDSPSLITFRWQPDIKN